jgi:hypothetical protein
MIPRALQQRGNGTRRRSRSECIAVVFETEYEDHRDVDEPLACELLGEDLNGKPYGMVRIKGITSKWARKNKVKSGVTTIFVPSGADIDDSARELVIPTGSAIQVSLHIPSYASVLGLDWLESFGNDLTLVRTLQLDSLVVATTRAQVKRQHRFKQAAWTPAMYIGVATSPQSSRLFL